MKLEFVSIVATFALFRSVFGVKRELFKTCEQNGFCHRNRHLANAISNKHGSYSSPYSVDETSIRISEEVSAIEGSIMKKLPNGKAVELPFTIEVLKSDNIRLTIDEKERSDPKSLRVADKRFKSRRFNEASKYALKGEPEISVNAKLTKESITDKSTGEKYLSIIYGDESEYEAQITLSPFKITVYYHGQPEIILNDRNFFNIEHWRTQDQQASELSPEETDYGTFKDEFKDSQGDHLPFGPESIGVDVSFIGYDKVFGIPEHADTFSLKDTTNDDPYRLFNVDIFEYETQSKFPMYGSIPFMVAQKKSATAGLFWINAADTYVDIKKGSPAQSNPDQIVLTSEKSTKTHWFSEAGILDLIIMVDKSPLAINKKYGELSGNPELPQLFTLGYHQCRWNYNDVDDVLDVSEKFDNFEIPYDVIWLDIEYTENKKYFTWKKGLFDDHVEMNKKLAETGRNLVAIIDPHIKTDYQVSNDIEKQGLGIKNSDNDDTYHGHCWPGESVWIDTFNPKSKAYWNKLFANNTDFSGDETNLHIWNDMSEPSVFSGPETTAPKDIVHYGGWEHRSVHNAYGLTFHEATYDAMSKRYVNKRPFILTRAYYAGSQRSAAMWSGDNKSKWEFLKISLPMALTSQVVGMPFTGSDVGGFFGDPSSELLTRWYQAGIWYPFFRGHAHIDSKRREPYIAGEPYTSIMRDAIRLRYSLLPVFYTGFHHASITNAPIITPLFYSNPENEDCYEIEDEFFVADSGLLVKPVTQEGATSVSIYIPDEKPYFDYHTHELIQGKGSHDLQAELEQIPILMQGGHIFSRKDRYRRSSKLMKYDPYTLVVALDEEGSAKGSLYIDDGETFDYKKDDDFVYVDFAIKDNKLQSSVNVGKQTPFTELLDKVKVEKIIIVGKDISFSSSAKVSQNGENWEAETIGINNNAFIIRNPAVAINKSWTIELN